MPSLASYISPSLLSLDNTGVAQSLRLKSALNTQYKALARPRSPLRVAVPAKPVRFRGSSIPHCPLMFGIDAACALKGSPRTEDLTFQLDSYAAQGTALHEHLQKWFGVAGLMLGRWRCQQHISESGHTCDAVLPSSNLNDVVLGPQFHCGHPMQYVEIEPKCGFRVQVADKQIDVEFSGHCDGVLLIDGKYLIVELKTKTAMAMRDIRAKNLPILEHYHQANSYRYVVPIYTKLDPSLFHDFMVVWYFDRADMSNNEPLIVPFNPSVFEREVEAHAVTEYLIQNRMWDRLVGICATSDTRPYCPHNALCFGANKTADLAVVFQGIPDNA